MPLIKHIKVGPALSGYDYRRRTELLQGDYIRHVANGTCSSIRTLGLAKDSRPSMIVFNTLKSLAEEGVEVGDEAFEAYNSSQDLLALKLSQLFEKTREVGVTPKKAKTTPLLATDYKSAHAIYADDRTVWFPKTALVMGAEIVILLRTCNIDEQEMTESNSLAMGMAMKDLSYLFPELEEYVQYLKNKASQDKAVSHAFRYLMTLIRPQDMLEQEARERAERYKDVRNFGTWG